MPQYEILNLVLGACAWLAIGALVGGCFYLTLRRSAQMLTTGSSVSAATALQLIRFTALAGLLGIIARHYGAIALLVVTFGILAAREAVLRLGALP
jgi:N-ATPase, AtpR subunit